MNDILKRIDLVISAEFKGRIASFSRKVQIPDGTIRSWYRKNLNPKADHLSKIASATGVSTDWLLTGKGPSPFEDEKTFTDGKNVDTGNSGAYSDSQVGEQKQKINNNTHDLENDSKRETSQFYLDFGTENAPAYFAKKGRMVPMLRYSDAVEDGFWLRQDEYEGPRIEAPPDLTDPHAYALFVPSGRMVLFASPAETPERGDLVAVKVDGQPLLVKYWFPHSANEIRLHPSPDYPEFISIDPKDVRWAHPVVYIKTKLR